MKFEKLTDEIINAFYEVYGELGYGFKENIYQKALALELEKNDLEFEVESPIKVHYSNEIIGEYFADIVVQEKVLLELKAKNELVDDHEAQVLNYLNATKYEVGLLLNFGPEAEIKRKAYDNNQKKYDPSD